jgi:hypothetical protein
VPACSVCGMSKNSGCLAILRYVGNVEVAVREPDKKLELKVATTSANRVAWESSGKRDYSTTTTSHFELVRRKQVRGHLHLDFECW